MNVYNNLFVKKMATQKVLVLLAMTIVLLAASSKSYKEDDDDCCLKSEIKVLGTGQVSVDADVAIIYAYIMKDGTTVSDALNNAQKVLNAIEVVLSQNKLPKTAIQTSYISIYPKYDYTTGTGVINGYTVYISLSITIKGINKDQRKVADIIEGLANAGVSSVSGITFDVLDKDKYATVARKSAFANALKKAKQYSEITWGKLGRILKVDESQLSYYPFYSSSTGNTAGTLRLGQNGATSNNVVTDSSIQLPIGKVSIMVDVIVTWLVNYEYK